MGRKDHSFCPSKFMNPPQPFTQPKVVASEPELSARDQAKAVWAYVTSLKEVQKRSGEREDFSKEKLQASIDRSLNAAGQKHHKSLTLRITDQVVHQLTRAFNGHKTPTFADIREAVNITFIDEHLVHASKAYAMYRLTNRGETDGPVYGHGMTVKRRFTKEGAHPFDQITWERRLAQITNEKGELVFEQKDVEVPKSWSQTATNIVVQKYFRGKVGTAERETSIRQLVGRVATTIADWGREGGYFQTEKDAEIFEHELTFILVNQMAAFNSPVWFNVGVNPKPQCSACFINSVQDDMRSILSLCMTEGMIFKCGSGSGVNLSNLRSSVEYLGGSNGRSSGPVSFMKGLDAFAGVIKSGGKTRRAAKMVILNADHPDIEAFITCKAEEEKKAWALMDAGYDGSIDGPAYASIYFQNANNSVRVTDEFLKAIEDDAEWTTHEVTTGKPSRKFRARELMKKIAEAAWQCGDPGMQYDTTTNRWHTCKKSGRINASNPCSEYVFLDDTACNLASLNLMKFRQPSADGQLAFSTEAFSHAAEIVITAMEITVGNSSYPTPAIEQNSYDFRPLGIGYANLGALLMSLGIAYDSPEARDYAAAITSLLSGAAYAQSARIAEKIGPFARFEENRSSCLEVMGMHRSAAYRIPDVSVPQSLQTAQRRAWDEVIALGEQFGLRNSQISLLAPTGTIAFFMDCDTTGVEPDIALVKYKWLVGGGMVKIVNQTVPEALARLRYSKEQISDILAYIDKKDTIEGAPHLREEDLPVFDCAFKPKNGERSIQYMGHVNMMAAVQPFLSGAISKTVNMPQSSTPEDIARVYMEGGKLGLKAIAIYRDGSKRQQPLTTSLEKDQSGKVRSTEAGARPRRKRLPDERRAITHKFNIGNHEGYITVGLYADGTPGEMFITMAKEGSVVSGLMDSFATTVSIALQYGVPLEVLVNKFVHMRFEPSGYTNNEHIRIAKSIVDYLFRWMAMKFLPLSEQEEVGVRVRVEEKTQQPSLFAETGDETRAMHATHTATFNNQEDAPACDTCGSMMIRNGACYKCLNCGATSGCS
jgi:ribonucleoside-diphosphate reductase alpha chain